MEDCLFCNIREIEKEKIIHETKNFMVVIPKGMIAQGHLLIVSKAHYKAFGEIPEDIEEEFLNLWNKLEKKIEKEFGEIFVVEYGNKFQSVAHAHLHFIPKKSEKYEFKSVVEEMFSPELICEEADFKKIKKIFIEEDSYCMYKEKNKLSICHTKDLEWDEVGKSLSIRTFLRVERGVKGIKWQNLDEEDIKKDKENQRITKEKIKF